MLAAFNQTLFASLFAIGNSSAFAQSLTVFFAMWFPYLVIISIIPYESFRRGSTGEILRTIISTSAVLIFTWLIVLALKQYFPFPRPFAYFSNIIPLVSESDSFGSFPSAHAAIFGALAGLAYAHKFPVRHWYLFAAVIIAVARVCAGVHWPVDVIVGGFFGFGLAYLLTTLALTHPRSTK